MPTVRLVGGLATQASPGTSVLMQPISPWFDVNNGFVDLTAIAEYTAHNTALTAAPPGVHIRTVDLSVRYRVHPRGPAASAADATARSRRGADVRHSRPVAAAAPAASADALRGR